MKTFYSLKFLSFLVITAFLFSILEFPAIPDQEEKRGFALLEEGKNLYFAGKFEKSITKLKEAISLFEEDPSIDEELRNSKIAESYFYIGLNLLGLNERFSAKEAFKNALKYQPDLASTIQSYSPEVRELISIVKKEVEEKKSQETKRTEELKKAKELQKSERMSKKTEEKPTVMTKPAERKPKKIGKTILYLIIGAIATGGVVYFLLSKKGKKEEIGSIEVSSKPEGARIYLDEVDTGKVTNTLLEKIKPGSHTVTLKLQGYRDYTTTVTVYNGQTSRVSFNFQTIFEFVTKWGSKGSGDGQFDGPEGIAVDSLGYVYVADTWNSRVQKFTSNGEFVNKWRTYGKYGWPRGIANDCFTYLYVMDWGDYLIEKYTLNGEFVGKWTSPEKFSTPTMIAVDSLGYVYVADSGNDRIQKFTSNGEFIGKWGTKGSGNGQFNFPYGIAVDSLGYVYVADSGNDRIQKFTSNGEFIGKWGTKGSGNGQFNSPHGIAVDSLGYVYVVETVNNRVQKFRTR